MSQGIHLRKYGVQTTIPFELYEVDGVDLRTNWTPAQSDCEIEKNEGGYTICDNTASGTTTYKIVLTATEMEFARGALKIVDSATKVFLDKIVYIETYGNASAMHAFDLNVATQDVSLTEILGTAVAESTGGNIATNFKTFWDDGNDATAATKMSTVDTISTVSTNIGSPANIDSGGATISANLKKIADDNAGATFDATNDSLNKIRARGDSAWVTATSVTVSDKTGFKLASDGVDAVSAASGTIKDIVDDTSELQTDWANGGRLDLLLDAIKAVTDDMKVLDTTIASVDTADTVFRVNAGLTGNDDINNAVCSIYDVTGGVWSGPRRVTDYVHGTLQITIDANTAFPLAASDRVVIWNVSYATTAAAGSITQGDLDDIADAVWEELMADHLTELTTGAKQNVSDRVGR